MSNKHDTDQDKLISRKPSTGRGVGVSENKTPSTGGDDNPMLPTQNFSNYLNNLSFVMTTCNDKHGLLSSVMT